MEAYYRQTDSFNRLKYSAFGIAVPFLQHFIASCFIDIYKCTDVGFREIPGCEHLLLIATFDSSTTTKQQRPMAYTNNINYSSYRQGSKMNPRLRQLAILSLVVLVGMMVSIFVNA